MGKKTANTNSVSAESTASPAAAPKKTSAARTQKHIKAKAVGVAAAVEGFVHSIVNAVDDRMDAAHAISQNTANAERVAEPAKAAVSTEPSPKEKITHEEISALAYGFYLARNGENGTPADDWALAERTLTQHASA